jgi:RNA polymerase sigma-70 factor, ECF subfamily
MSLFMSAVSSVHIEYDETEMSDEMLVSNAKAGDAGAFVELSERHSDRILQAAYRITRNWQDAEDALQDSLMKAFAHLNDFQERSSFSTWLTRIAMNSALMILRKKRGCVEIPIDGTGDSTTNNERWEPRALTEDPESRYVRRERERLLREAILRLPPVFRDVVELRQAREYSARQIAKALGISVPAVKSRLARAKLTLRASLLEGSAILSACSEDDSSSNAGHTIEVTS